MKVLMYRKQYHRIIALIMALVMLGGVISNPLFYVQASVGSDNDTATQGNGTATSEDGTATSGDGTATSGDGTATPSNAIKFKNKISCINLYVNENKNDNDDDRTIKIDFSAESENEEDSNITYSLGEEKDFCKIDSDTGVLSIFPEKLNKTGSGEITIKASLKETETEETTINEAVNNIPKCKKVTINWEVGDLLSVTAGEEYILGTNNGVAASIVKINDDDADYKITFNPDCGLKEDGKDIKVADLPALLDAVGNGSLKAEFTLTKDVKVSMSGDEDSITIYEKVEKEYSISIRANEKPENPYSLKYEDETSLEEGTKVHKKNIIVTPAEGYTVSKTVENLENFENTVTFKKQDKDLYIYLQDKDTGGITSAIEIEIDTIAPEFLGITFGDEQDGEQDKHYLTKEEKLSITVLVEEKGSGLESIAWKCDGSEYTELGFHITDEGIYEATLCLPTDKVKEYIGRIQFKATDKAGNYTTIAEGKAEYSKDNKDNEDNENNENSTSLECYVVNSIPTYYSNKDVNCIFTFEGNLLDSEDVQYKITNKTAPFDPVLSWNGENGTHRAECTLPFETENDEYSIEIFYRDAGKIRQFLVNKVIIENTRPKLTVEYKGIQRIESDDSSDLSKTFYTLDTETGENNAKLILKIKEDNFDPDKICILDENGNDIKLSGDWTVTDGNEYCNEYCNEISLNENTEYQIKISGTDACGNYLQFDGQKEQTDAYETSVFVIDTQNPVITQSCDSKKIKCETGNKRYCTDNQRIKLTIFDQYFNEGNAKVMLCKDRVLQKDFKVEWKAEKECKYSAVVLLNGDGDYYVKVKYKDYCGNPLIQKGKVYHYIVDTTNPIINELYSNTKCMYEEENEYGEWAKYYVSDQQLTLTITEKNFNSKAVSAKVFKDGVKQDGIVFDWQKEEDTDKYSASYTMDSDGTYTVEVSYADYCKLPMLYRKDGRETENYKSDKIIIDTTNPTIQESYRNSDCKMTQTADGVVKKYYAGAQELTLTITERNFNAEAVDVIVYKNGKKQEGLVFNWIKTEEKDEYSTSYTMNSDGEYVVEVQYTDYCEHPMLYDGGEENAAINYKSDIIIVDTKRPIIEESYSNEDCKTTQNTDGVVTKYYAGPQNLTLTITERNFNAEAVDVKVYKDGEEQKGLVFDWEKEEGKDEYSISYAMNSDGAYVVEVQYEDYCGHSMLYAGSDGSETENYKSPIIVVDTKNPIIQESYSNQDCKTTQTTDGTVTKYYAGAQELTLCITERNFNEKAVDVKVYKDGAVQEGLVFDWKQKEEGTDEYYASYVMDADAKYMVAVQYADYCGLSVLYTNSDKKVTENYKSDVIVVDTTNPTIEESYNNQDCKTTRIVDGVLTRYYAGAQELTLTITERNFNASAVLVKVYKDGVEQQGLVFNWTQQEQADKYSTSYTMDADAKYIVEVQYTDYSRLPMVYTSSDGSVTENYRSDAVIIDTINPRITDNYSDIDRKDILLNEDGETIRYYASAQSLTLTITEKNFDPGAVSIKAYKDGIEQTDLVFNWNQRNGTDEYSTVYDMKPDGIYVVEVQYQDYCKYPMKYTKQDKTIVDNYKSDIVTVDTIAPVTLDISYEESVLEANISGENIHFYNSGTKVTIRATDVTAGVKTFECIGLTDDGTAQLFNRLIQDAGIEYSNNGKTAAATIDVPGATLGADGQFDGKIKFIAVDRSGNRTERQEDRRLIVDTIAPDVTVGYNAPFQQVNDISYYNGDITAAITVREANFFQELDSIRVAVTKDGEEYPVTPIWNEGANDIHTGTFTLSQDGNYTVRVFGADGSGNVMQEYVSNLMVIDTEGAKTAITINGGAADGKAFKEAVVLALSFLDPNLDTYEVRLVRSGFAEKNVDVSEKFVTGYITATDTQGSGVFDAFEKIAENDGIYTLYVTVTDKAGNKVNDQATFTVNRYGSVYEFDDYLMWLIQNGGAYVSSVTKDLVITEYNADRLVSESVEISLDGRPLKNVLYRVSPELSRVNTTENNDWYQYVYTISRENFAAEGIYKISVSSKDEVGNTPENINYKDKEIVFRVDYTAPEITSILGLQEGIINATSQDVKYTVYDAMGLASVVVYVEGEEVSRITDFASDLNNYTGMFTLYESTQAQRIRIVVTDLAGNITDTDAEDFTSAYVFNNSVIISTNAWVRFISNKELFYETIICAALILLIAGAAAAASKRKKLKPELG